MKRNRRSPFVVLAGAVGTALLGMSMTGTLSAFTASIQNTVNNLTTGTLVMQESNASGSVTCTSSDGTNNSVVCKDINKYGGQALTPGQSTTTTVSITNAGTATPAAFTLTPAACTTSAASQTVSIKGVTAGNLCDEVQLVVTEGGTQKFSGSLSDFNSALSLTPLAAGQTQSFTFKVTLPASADNSYQGLMASQPMTWTFSS